MEFVLIGNPNTGKTTFFNALTKSDNHTGNWHGVTNDISKKEIVHNGKKMCFYDLPGLYSFSHLGMEEFVATEYVAKNADKTYLCLCDSENIERNLYLAICMLEKEIKTVLIVNNIKGKSTAADFEFLRAFGVPYFLVDPRKKNQIKNLKNNLENIDENCFKNQINLNYNLGEKQKIIENILKKYEKNPKNIKKYIFDVFSGDFFCLKSLNISFDDEQEIKKLANKDFMFCFAGLRHKKIAEICKTFRRPKSPINGKIDKILLNKYLAIPIFFVLMAAVFYLTFFCVGRWLSDVLQALIVDGLGGAFLNFLKGFSPPVWVFDLFEKAVVGSVGVVLGFLPQVALLGGVLTLLEGSGYISRIAFLFDDIMQKFGLSGKSTYTMIMGFGCSTSACMTARNMEEKNAKIKTALITPYMSCTAKLPIYMAIGGAVFGRADLLVVLFLYLLGICVSLGVSLVFEKTVLRSQKQNFLMELPCYRLPSLNGFAKSVLKSCTSFALRVGGTVLLASVVMFFLQGFDARLCYVAGSSRQSLLGTLAMIISPIFVPLGFSGWAHVSALLAGLVAKEVVVAALALACGGSLCECVLNPSSVVFLTQPAALSFLCFCLLYVPCVATLSVLKKEVGTKWTVIGAVVQFLIAYFVSAIVYGVGLLCTLAGGSVVAICLLCFAMFVFLVLLAKKKLKNKKCRGCNLCK